MWILPAIVGFKVDSDRHADLFAESRKHWIEGVKYTFWRREVKHMNSVLHAFIHTKSWMNSGRRICRKYFLQNGLHACTTQLWNPLMFLEQHDLWHSTPSAMNCPLVVMSWFIENRNLEAVIFWFNRRWRGMIYWKYCLFLNF